MSRSIFLPSGDSEYTTANNVTTLHQSNDIRSLLLELRNDIKALKIEVSDMKQEIKDLKDGNTRAFIKLTEEVIAVKLENRQHNKDAELNDEFLNMGKLPFTVIGDLKKFDEELQRNEDQLKQFKQFIAKTGGEGPSQFIRAAIRTIFSDELASAYSWKGTSSKPSAEKCFIVTKIKNICHVKYKCTDKDMNAVLQKHFVHAKDRVTKRKRQD